MPLCFKKENLEKKNHGFAGIYVFMFWKGKCGHFPLGLLECPSMAWTGKIKTQSRGIKDLRLRKIQNKLTAKFWIAAMQLCILKLPKDFGKVGCVKILIDFFGNAFGIVWFQGMLDAGTGLIFLTDSMYSRSPHFATGALN